MCVIERYIKVDKLSYKIVSYEKLVFIISVIQSNLSGLLFFTTFTCCKFLVISTIILIDRTFLASNITKEMGHSIAQAQAVKHRERVLKRMDHMLLVGKKFFSAMTPIWITTTNEYFHLQLTKMKGRAAQLNTRVSTVCGQLKTFGNVKKMDI